MERVTGDALTAILRRETKEYARGALTPVGDSKFYYLENLDDKVFGVLVPYFPPRSRRRLF